jgi:hypothetical protein
MGKYTGPSALSMAHRLRYRGAIALALPIGNPIRVYGLTWYDNVRLWASDLAERYIEYGATTSTIAGAIAALSPQCSWLDQTRFLPAFLESVLVARDPYTLPHPGFTGSRIKARDILLGKAKPSRILGGPKVRAFYAGILGARHSVCVDRHAASIALGYRRESLPPKWLAEIQQAYRLAARWLGVMPRDLQALLWCFHKGTGAADIEDAPTFYDDAPNLRAHLSESRAHFAPSPDTMAPLVSPLELKSREEAESPF